MINDNMIKGLMCLQSVDRKMVISQVTLIHLNKAKMMCCCTVNLVKAQDNNANGFHAKAYLLWDFCYKVDFHWIQHQVAVWT